MAAYTTAQRDALKNAIARGVLSVTYNGTRTDYRSLNEMNQLLAQMEAELAETAGTNVTRQILARPKKGLS